MCHGRFVASQGGFGGFVRLYAGIFGQLWENKKSSGVKIFLVSNCTLTLNVIVHVISTDLSAKYP